MNGVSSLIKETPEDSYPFLPGEDTARRMLSINKEGGPQQTSNLLASLSWTSQPLGLCKIKIGCLPSKPLSPWNFVIAVQTD